LEIVATPVLDEDQVTEVVKFWVLASEKVPVAVYCWMVPCAIWASGGETAIETRVAFVTVNPVFPDTLPIAAVMVVLPADTPVARPLLPAVLEMVAMLAFDEDQVTELVMFWVLASE